MGASSQAVTNNSQLATENNSAAMQSYLDSYAEACVTKDSQERERTKLKLRESIKHSVMGKADLMSFDAIRIQLSRMDLRLNIVELELEIKTLDDTEIKLNVQRRNASETQAVKMQQLGVRVKDIRKSISVKHNELAEAYEQLARTYDIREHIEAESSDTDVSDHARNKASYLLNIGDDSDAQGYSHMIEELETSLNRYDELKERTDHNHIGMISNILISLKHLAITTNDEQKRIECYTKLSIYHYNLAIYYRDNNEDSVLSDEHQNKAEQFKSLINNLVEINQLDRRMAGTISNRLLMQNDHSKYFRVTEIFDNAKFYSNRLQIREPLRKLKKSFKIKFDGQQFLEAIVDLCRVINRAKQNNNPGKMFNTYYSGLLQILNNMSEKKVKYLQKLLHSSDVKDLYGCIDMTVHADQPAAFDGIRKGINNISASSSDLRKTEDNPDLVVACCKQYAQQTQSILEKTIKAVDAIVASKKMDGLEPVNLELWLGINTVNGYKPAKKSYSRNTIGAIRSHALAIKRSSITFLDLDLELNQAYSDFVKLSRPVLSVFRIFSPFNNYRFMLTIEKMFDAANYNSTGDMPQNDKLKKLSSKVIEIYSRTSTESLVRLHKGLKNNDLVELMTGLQRIINGSGMINGYSYSGAKQQAELIYNMINYTLQPLKKAIDGRKTKYIPSEYGYTALVGKNTSELQKDIALSPHNFKALDRMLNKLCKQAVGKTLHDQITTNSGGFTKELGRFQHKIATALS